MRLTKKQFSFDTITINYYEVGEGPLFILLPGWGARPLVYKSAIAILGKKFHVIIPELPGFGVGNSPKEVWNLGDYAAFYKEFLNSFPQNNCIIAGHSLGGGIALYTATKQEKIKKLILIDAYGLPSERRRGTLSFLYQYQLMAEMMIPSNFKISALILQQFLPILKNTGYILRFTLKIFDKRIAQDSSVFKNIQVPIEIWWGKKDTIFGKESAQTLHNILPSSRLTYVEGSHNWIVFHPERMKVLVEQL